MSDSPEGQKTVFDNPDKQEKESQKKSGEDVEISDMHIAQKILCVIKELAPIEKAGKTNQYSYTKEVDVKKAVKPLFIKYGLIAIPSAENKEFVQSENKKGTLLFLTNIDFVLTLINVHDPKEQVQVKVPAAGLDFGGDKGPYKAITGGLKAALLALFLIETDHGHDPENESASDKKNASNAVQIPADIKKLAQSMKIGKSKVLQMASQLNNDWVELAKLLKKMSEEQEGGA